MIYTVTLNPSLDYIVSVDHFRQGGINRTAKEILNPGGKGINVSLVLKNLGYESIALGFTAGFTGKEIVRLLEEREIRSSFIHVKNGLSRINVKIRSDEETEINGMGPEVSREDISALFRQLDGLSDGDVLVLAGAIPAGMPETMYGDIMKHLSGKRLRILVDAAGPLLTGVLKHHPFLVKPNCHELGEIYGVTLGTRDEVVPYARRLQEAGAANVLVSLAGQGAVLVTEEGQIFQSEAPAGRVRNSVGAGDSMAAGFLAGYLPGGDYEQAFYMGICAGSASAFSEELATRKKTEQLLAAIRRQ